MELSIRRSYRDDGLIWSSIVYTADFQLGLDEEELDIAVAHGLTEAWVYHSDALLDALQQADKHFEAATETPLLPASGQTMIGWYGDILSGLGSNLAGIAALIESKLAFKVTVADLIAGKHIEADSADELRFIMGFILGGVETLAERLGTVLTFLDEDEDVIEL